MNIISHPLKKEPVMKRSIAVFAVAAALASFGAFADAATTSP
jgi:hypothetical protein